jgi:hypothetical protein
MLFEAACDTSDAATWVRASFRYQRWPKSPIQMALQRRATNTGYQYGNANIQG